MAWPPTSRDPCTGSPPTPTNSVITDTDLGVQGLDDKVAVEPPSLLSHNWHLTKTQRLIPPRPSARSLRTSPLAKPPSGKIPSSGGVNPQFYKSMSNTIKTTHAPVDGHPRTTTTHPSSSTPRRQFQQTESNTFFWAVLFSVYIELDGTSLPRPVKPRL